MCSEMADIDQKVTWIKRTLLPIVAIGFIKLLAVSAMGSKISRTDDSRLKQNIKGGCKKPLKITAPSMTTNPAVACHSIYSIVLGAKSQNYHLNKKSVLREYRSFTFLINFNVTSTSYYSVLDT
uniref:Uncharacterized protein n=1 Tax=Glossina palpalis gambiensis TaxID=67801 RepID=A0A1B0C0Y2_9MUSC